MIWLLLSSGRGPGECQMAVSGLHNVLRIEAEAHGISCAMLEAEEAEHGYHSVLVSLTGDGAEALARSWEGTVQWTWESTIRPGWKRKNWFIGVSLLSPPEAGREIDERDLRWETMRASGAGGQHVNKTESAVRLTHVPSGLVVIAREERSQHRNRSLALARMSAALADQARKGAENKKREQWSRHDALELGNPVRIYQGKEFRRKL